MTLGRLEEAQKLEQQVYELAEKILAQRPSDLHALSDRYYAADELSLLASRRHDDASAAEYATRSVQAGEDLVRFNPADLTSWGLWATGKAQVADLQLDRGEIAHALASMHETMALEQDKRRPSSLGPILWYRWVPFAVLQAQVGDKAAAEQSAQAFVRDLGEGVVQLKPDDSRRLLFAIAGQRLQNRLQLIGGGSQAALTNATADLARIEQIKVSADDSNGTRTKNNSLRADLQTASAAAIRLGRLTQAESLARQWLAVPADPQAQADPQVDGSHARAVLAHAVAMQARGDEARAILQPALAYYQHEQDAGAHGTQFRRDSAYALYVNALTYTADIDQPKREAALNAAATLIVGASAEAQNLADLREVADLIAAARTSKRG
jgi:hypothetical protein